MIQLSIVVPVWRELRQLDSLLAGLSAAFAQDEIIVVDGGSDDGSLDVVRRFPRVTLLEGTRGRARQMNTGARAATGDILLFLHADTRLPRGARAAILDALGDPGVVAGRFDVQFDNPRQAFRMIAALMNLRSRLSGISTGDQALFVRRAVFEALGGYAEIALMEDIELTHRLKRAGRLAALRLRVTTAARKWEQNGVARTIVLMWTLRFLYVCGVSPARLHRWYYGPTEPTVAPSPNPGNASGKAPTRR
ncbi:MAG: TIGR04283 family arsenosugar biosynthesis glycosyltransferase [Candidatus Rokuibacteriota bacterium]